MTALDLPDEAYAVALAGLPGMGPARLGALFRRWQPPEAWSVVRDGCPLTDPGMARAAGPQAERVVQAWRAAVRSVDPAATWDEHVRSGFGVTLRGRPSFPDALAGDTEPPEVLFTRGDTDALSGPRVAIVGTRRCTRYGRDVARDLGRDLAAAGVRVVSGLAIGIDGAAHAGALAVSGSPGAAPPIGVVATGLDVVYPRRHNRLWDHVAEAGVLLTEAPLGTRPERWRFPARNRLIAGLADVVVIVESHAAGGSLITAKEALERDRAVMAVPGPIRSAASEGTNRLLHDGMAPVCDAGDVLTALGLTAAAVQRPRPAPPPSDPIARAVLDALGWQPGTLEQIVERSGRPPAQVAVQLAALEAEGRLARRGAWWERVACGAYA
jgi:DNA processing protein